jgi:hypothetical protein
MFAGVRRILNSGHGSRPVRGLRANNFQAQSSIPYRLPNEAVAAVAMWPRLRFFLSHRGIMADDRLIGIRENRC